VAIASADVDALGHQMARELSSGMDRFAREIELQAANPVFRQPAAAPAPLRAGVEAIQKVYPEFAHVSLIDAGTGKVVIATGGIFEGGDASGRPVFEQGRAGLFVGDVHDAVRLATLLPKPANGEPLRFLDVGAPVLGADNKPLRVLAAHLSWDWTRAIQDHVLRPVEASRAVQILLVDSSGAVVLPPDASVPVGTPLRKLQGDAAGRTTGRWADGVNYLSVDVPTSASGRFPGLGWRVVVRQPMSIVLAPADRLRSLFLLGGLLIGLLAAVIAWVVTGRIVKPVADLARAAAGLAEGQNLGDPSRFSGIDLPEVAAVRGAFKRVTGEALSRAERLLGELNSVYQGAPVGLCVIDGDLRYVRANQVWTEAFGHGTERLLPERIDAGGTSQALVDAIGHAIQSAAVAAPSRVEVETDGPRGPRVWQVVIAPLPARAGRPDGVSAVATDVTEIRRAEQALRLADDRKNQFVAMLAHELRNPLAPITNALGVLDMEPQPAQGARMRQVIHKQLQHMVRLIDDLLDVSRVNLNKIALAPEDVPAREICDAAIETVRPLMDAKGQRLEVDVEDSMPPLRADRVRLTQVVCNLLNNASKYGRQGGSVRLQVAHDAGRARIVVEDDGRGIPAEFLPHVFELFEQGTVPLDRTEGGLGIGLSLVKTLVEMHGGEVRAESDGPGRGSRFTVWLPLHVPGTPAPRPPVRPPAARLKAGAE
jgi:PAS domain S-box-containing protein